MKKVLAFMMALIMTVCMAGACLTFAGEAQAELPEGETPVNDEAVQVPLAYDYDEDVLTVGAVTPFTGEFFTSMWGNLVSDMDVRALIHGYDLVEWRVDEGGFGVDHSVVSGSAVTNNEQGDLTYLITLADDLYYSDGSPITAWDYAFSMLLSFSPEIEQIGADAKNGEYILGYQEYMDGTVPYLAGVRVLSDRMFSITLNHEYLPFFYELGWLDCVPYPIGQIAPGCEVKDDGNGVYIDGEFTAQLLEQTILDPENGYLAHPSVTSGPYKLVSYTPEQVELEINEYYKGDSEGIKPSIQKIIFKVVDNANVIDALADGDVMLLNKVVNAQSIQQGMALTQENDIFTYDNYARNGFSFISFCCEKPEVQDAAVRKAISMCLDKDALVEDVVGSFGLRADGYYGIGQWMYQIINGTITPPENAAQEGEEEKEKEEQNWDELTLDNVTVYDLDIEAAVQLLEEQGWTLNRDGGAFVPGTDDVRCKEIDGQIVPLELTLLGAQESTIPQYLQETFADNLAQAGILLIIETVPSPDLMAAYYRQTERDCEMILVGSNFDVVFDPSVHFRPDTETADAEQAAERNIYNTSAINDRHLYDLAIDMRRTQPGDLYEYCRKWIAFQEYFSEVMPVIPLYSNVYFDFYPKVLHNYNIQANLTWGDAVIEAYLGDVSEAERNENAE